MMWPWFFSDFALALLSSCIYFSFLTNTLQFDVSDDLFGVPLSSGLGSSTNDPSLDPISNSELLDAFTSDESLTLGDPPIIDSFISSDLFGQDNLLSQNLLQSSNDQCSFNSALVNADSGQTEYFLRRFKKRRSETECKNPQRGSNSNEPPPPPEDPQNFLNGLPLFEGYEDSDLHEDTEICEPRLHLDRTIPMCLIGLSEMAVALEWYADVKPVGCAPLYRLASDCPSGSTLMCCKKASIETEEVDHTHTMNGLMAQNDFTYTLNRRSVSHCDETSGVGLAPFRHGPYPAAPSHRPS